MLVKAHDVLLIYAISYKLSHTFQFLYNAMFGIHALDHVISDLFYKGTILKVDYYNSYNDFVKFHGINFGYHNITTFYPIL